MNMEQWKIQAFAVMKQVLVNQDIIDPRASHGFPSDLVLHKCSAKRFDRPLVYLRVAIAVVELRECLRRPVLVLKIVFEYHVHQRPAVGMIDEHLPGTRTLQSFLIKLLHRRQAMSGLQVIETIQKIKRRFLILKRVLMLVITFGHPDSISVIKPAVDVRDFTNRLMRAFDGKEIEYSCGYEDRTRVHQQEQPGMINSV